MVTTSVCDEGRGTQARQSITPSLRLITAVTGMGNGSATLAAARFISASQKREATCAIGASGVITGGFTGLAMVIRHSMQPEHSLAASRASVPPRLIPTTDTFLRCRFELARMRVRSLL